MLRVPPRRSIALAAALLAALAAGGCRTGAGAKAAPAAAPKTPPNPRLAEGVNTVSFVAADRSVLHGLALARDPKALRRAAHTGVVALRDACASRDAVAPGGLAELCGHLPPRLEALERAAAADDDEALRLAARGVMEPVLADLRIARGRSLELFLGLASGRVLLEWIASDARWPELRRAPAASLGRSLSAALDRIEEACSSPATVGPGWDCARAAPPIEALRALAQASTVNESARAPARELLLALPRAR